MALTKLSCIVERPIHPSPVFLAAAGATSAVHAAPPVGVGCVVTPAGP